MRASRIAVVLCALSALAAIFYFTFNYERPVYIGPTLAVITLTWSVLQLVHNHWSKTHPDPQSETPAPEQVAAAADWLAGAVHESWRKEAAARRITTPVPVPVQWQWAEGLSPQEAQRPPVPGAGPRAFPGSGQPERIPDSGDVTELHDLYMLLPRGRLVITGEPGSGKTGAMILLLLEALAWREKLAPEERSHVPVPVLLTLAGWDPASMSLPQFNTDVPGLRIVMTSRLAEYAEATRTAPLESAAVIKLRPVPPEVAAEFLLHERPMHNRAEWQKVADYIKDDPTALINSSSFPA